MILFFPHIALTFLVSWLVFYYTGWEMTAGRLIIAGIVVFSLLWPLSYLFNRTYFKKLPKLMNLIVYFIKELLVANFRVAYDVLTPTTHMRPFVIALPLDAKNDYEITLLANMISLTPGTLSLDLSEDKRYLFVHAISFNELGAEEIKKGIKDGFEKKLLEITR